MKFTKCKPSKKVNSLLKNPYVKPECYEEDLECSGFYCTGEHEKNPCSGWCRQCAGQDIRICNYCCASESMNSCGQDRHHWNRTKGEREEVRAMISDDVQDSLYDLYHW